MAQAWERFVVDVQQKTEGRQAFLVLRPDRTDASEITQSQQLSLEAIEKYKQCYSTCTNPCTKKLLSIIIEKQTNLCLAIDVTATSELLEAIDSIGSSICLLKTQVEMLEGVPDSLIPALLKAKSQHRFMILEDRHFGDIGNTAALQYAGGSYRIVEWADIVSAHSVSGPDIIPSLAKVATRYAEPRGVMLISDMPGGGDFFDEEYRAGTFAMAQSEAASSFVVGFIDESRDRRPMTSATLTPIGSAGPLRTTFEKRLDTCANPLTRRLLSIMIEKRTNLCVAADVTSASSLLELVELIGPHICVLKMHIDFLTISPATFVPKLLELKAQHKFLIFEDRKYAEREGSLVEKYVGGIYKTVEWADLVTVHANTGNNNIAQMKKASRQTDEARGILLLAKMSSRGNLCTDSYGSKTCALAKEHEDFVVGFIAQSRTEDMPQQSLVLTPGVSLSSTGDGAGQQYNEPSSVIERGSDIIIVGRGIVNAQDKLKETIRYKEAGWTAYLSARDQFNVR